MRVLVRSSNSHAPAPTNTVGAGAWLFFLYSVWSCSIVLYFVSLAVVSSSTSFLNKRSNLYFQKKGY